MTEPKSNSARAPRERTPKLLVLRSKIGCRISAKSFESTRSERGKKVMRRYGNIAVLISLAIVGASRVPQAQGAALGSIRGFIKDGAGEPLAGAIVFVLGEPVAPAKSEKPIKQLKTDDEGKFIATGINPGRYVIKAAAAGYKAVEVSALVKANKATIFDSILLRRSETLADETLENSDSKYAARALKRTIFHFDDQKKYQKEDSRILADAVTETHGYVSAFFQSAPSDMRGASFAGTNFAVSQQVEKIGHLLVSGQVGQGIGAPQRLQALTSINAGDRHQLSVALGYGRLLVAAPGIESKLGQVSVSATDTWQIRGPFIIVYGVEFARFTEGASGVSILPRFGIAADAGPRTKLFAGFVPGSSSDTQAQITSETGEVIFPEQKPVAVASLPSGLSEPRPDRSFRLQFGGEQILSENSSIELMAFVDTISGNGVGLLAIPIDGEHAASQGLRAYDQNGGAKGVTVVFKHKLGKAFNGCIGYAFGEGQQLDARGISDPASLFARGFFHVITAKVDGHFVRTGTRISTIYRLSSGRAVFGIDPFQGKISTYDPNLSFLVSQELPTFNLIPGQLSAVLDVRNLLDQQASVNDDQQELISIRFHRLVRVGVALRF